MGKFEKSTLFNCIQLIVILQSVILPTIVNGTSMLHLPTLEWNYRPNSSCITSLMPLCLTQENSRK
jgi:hypothetical protein